DESDGVTVRNTAVRVNAESGMASRQLAAPVRSASWAAAAGGGSSARARAHAAPTRRTSRDGPLRTWVICGRIGWGLLRAPVAPGRPAPRRADQAAMIRARSAPRQPGAPGSHSQPALRMVGLLAQDARYRAGRGPVGPRPAGSGGAVAG